MTKLYFAIRFALKNLFFYKIRSILLLFSFITLLVITLLGLSTKPVVEAYYYQKMVDPYQDIDFHMGISENTKTRFFSINALNHADIEDVVNEFIPVFEIKTLLDINNEKIYINVFASEIEDFNKITNENSITSLNSDQVIITKSLADKYFLSLGDEIKLYVGSIIKSYQIIEIINDNGLFREYSIFINKEHCISLFLFAIHPELGGLNPTFFRNIYNRVYFDVNPDVDIKTAINSIKSIVDYQDLEFENAVNYQRMEHLVNRGVSLFMVVMLFVYLAVILVLQTTFILIYEEKTKAFAIIGLLGGSKIYSYFIILIEMIILFGIAIVSSIFLANITINLGFSFVGINRVYQLHNSIILMSSLIVAALFILTSIYYFFKYYKKSEIEHSKEEVIQTKCKRDIYTLLGLILVYIFIEVFLLERYFVIVQAVIIILGSYFATKIILLILQVVNKNRFLSLHLKVLFSKNAFYNYLKVILICFISIFLLILTNDYQMRRVNSFHDEYKINYALSNLVRRFDNTFNEVSELDIESIDKVLMYRHPNIIELNETIRYFISLDETNIDLYFNLEIDDVSFHNLANREQAVILLPERYQKLYGYQIGEKVNMYLNPIYDNQEFIIGGFFVSQTNEIAFSNILMLDEYDVVPNTLFINSNNDLLKSELINRYSKNMVYIIDFEENINLFAEEVLTIIKYISYICLIIIGCFILSIINNSLILFERMKAIYSRIFVLGSSKQRLIISVIVEQIIVFTAIIIISLIGIILLNRLLADIVLVFGDYENVSLSIKGLWIGIILSILVYMFTRVLYLLRVASIKPSAVIKTF